MGWDRLITGDVEGDLKRLVALRKQRCSNDEIREATGFSFRRLQLLVRLARRRGLIKGRLYKQNPGLARTSPLEYPSADDFILQQDHAAAKHLAAHGVRYCDQPGLVRSLRYVPVTQPANLSASFFGSPLGALAGSGGS